MDISLVFTCFWSTLAIIGLVSTIAWIVNKSKDRAYYKHILKHDPLKMWLLEKEDAGYKTIAELLATFDDERTIEKVEDRKSKR